MDVLPDKLIRLHETLAAHGIPHAFGGAIALAFYGEPRDTRDVDVNIALPPAEYARVLDALAVLFPIANRQKAEADLTRLAQTWLRWENMVVDIFIRQHQRR